MAELKFYGAGCFEIKTKEAIVLIDPYDKSYGKQISIKDKIVVLTQDSLGDYSGSLFTVSSPGEFEVSKVGIQGISARLNIDVQDSGVDQGTIYRLTIGDVTIGVIGNIDPKLTDDQLESIGLVDYLIVPVGGHGLSIEPSDAAKLVTAIEPKVVIASHFADQNISYPVPQEDVSVFAKEIGLESNGHSKIKLNHPDMADEMELIVLENQS